LAVGGEEDVGLGVSGGEGEDVESVGGDYVGGEEVDLVGGVGGAVVVDAAAIGIFLAALESALYLHAEEVAVVVYGEIVGGAVAAGAGEDESAFGGAELESEFGPFSAEFGMRDVGDAVAHAMSLRECGA
jgi:hypothetical protein